MVVVGYGNCECDYMLLGYLVELQVHLPTEIDRLIAIDVPEQVFMGTCWFISRLFAFVLFRK